MPSSRLRSSTYYDKHARPTKALYRARQPYLVKNAIAGVCVMGFVISVYAFTIRAISQDEFEDVPVPDAPIQPAQAPHMSNFKSAGRAQ